ncbi:MAG: hypothetical protein IT251_02285 [Chitinophagaceae bacterium]|nr:hypothetical protein [Chitinophagaceae bacterium]
MLSDKEIKDKLNNYSSPVSERVWQNIVVEQQKNKSIIQNYFTGARLSFFVGLLLTTVTLGYIIKQQSNRSVNLANSSGLLTQKTNQNITQNIFFNNYSKQNKELEQKVAFGESKLNSPLTSSNGVSKIKIDKNATVKNTNQLIPNNKFYTSSSVNTNVYTATESINNNTTDNFKSGNDSYHSTVDIISNSNLHSEEINIQENNQSNLIKGTTEKVFLRTTLPLAKIANQKLSYKLYQNTEPLECPGEYSSYKKNWYVEGFIAPEYVMKKVYSNNPANDAYLRKKDSVEKMVAGISIGAKFTRGLSKNLYIKGGLQYNQMIEKTSLMMEKERKEITVITINTVTDINGNTVTVADTSKQLQITYARSVNYNSIKSIELPISLGYEFYRKNFRASVNAGFIVNLSSWYSGKIFDTSYQMVNIKERPGIYKQNVGLSLYGSISLIKPLSESAEIFAEPYFRYSLTNPKYNAYGFKQKFNAVGLSMGLRFKLNKNYSSRTFN